MGQWAVKPSDIPGLLRDLDAAKARRTLQAWESHGPILRLGGVDLINFSSNDYLGLSREPRVVESARKAVLEDGAGNPSSRLICGHTGRADRLERRLAEWKGTEAALILPSGYMANLAILGTLGDGATTRIVDRLAHASLLDGMQTGPGPHTRFKHNDVGDLVRCLAERKTSGALVATESVFSMEGDRAPLAEIDRVCGEGEHWFVIDEAHGTGLFGPGGSGLAADLGPGKNHRVIMSTFGKALGGYGACVAGSRDLIDFLITRARPFIFTTALPPAVLGALEGSLDFLEENPGAGSALLSRVAAFRRHLAGRNVPMVPGDTQILSIPCGSNERALDLSAHLRSKGMLGVAIRPPTVPPGQARVRFTFCRFHTDGQMEALADALASYFTASKPSP